jgi:uncharacterized protein
MAAPAADVWALLNDPLGLAACVPGVRDVRRLDERTFEGSITAAVGPMNGDFSFTAIITRSDFPHALEVTMEGVDSVTRSRLETQVVAGLVEDGATTTMAYRADVRVKGRLAILGGMVLRATATMLIGQVTRCLQARLEAAAAADRTAG